MKEIVCPNCGKAFTVDDSGYAKLLEEVKTKEFDRELEKRISELESKKKIEFELSLEKAKQAKEEELNKLRKEVNELSTKLNSYDKEKELEIKLALSNKDNEISALTNEMNAKLNEQVLNEKALKENFDLILKSKDEQIEYYKDLKTKMSTKLVGETLEQHCKIEFDKIRMAAFPNAYFEKDNDAKSGSKGDFIYRECDVNGVEIISIMFEMKNENETTATKHKNEDFFKELDKDRTEKKCEYAVLVSMLEADNDLYNSGIVDVSYKYPKMYVVRPQCFISIISILRNASMNALQYKNDLMIAREQNIDIANFEDRLEEFKGKFLYNYDLAKKHFDDAIKEIDNTISHLEKVKKELTTSSNQLRLANEKAQDITIKSLTKDNPTMREKFEELKK